MEGEGAVVDESRRCEGWSNEERVDVEADGGEEYVCVCKYSTVGMQATSRRAKTLIGQICYTRKDTHMACKWFLVQTCASSNTDRTWPPYSDDSYFGFVCEFVYFILECN